MVLNAFVGSSFHLEALESVLSLGNSNIVLRHGIFSFSDLRRYAADRGLFPIPCRNTVSGETVDPLYSHLSALFVLYRSLGESRCNSIVDRVIENIDSNF